MAEEPSPVTSQDENNEKKPLSKDVENGTDDTSSANSETTMAIESASGKKSPRPQSTPKYPKSVFFIVSNEFCERFSYYGMRAVLTLYFINVLKHSEDEATEAFHGFAMACYFTPVIGAIISDSLLGKFRTIFYISILYALGNIVLSYASYIEHETLSITGLVLIAFGTGGIKPCVAAFGGDQFGPNQQQQLQQFFSLFYLSINAGSLISMFVTPIFREVNCSERGDCFPLAFGVPAVLMVMALILFVAGKRLYKIIPAAKGNIVVTVVCCIGRALINRIRAMFGSSDVTTSGKDHWLEYASDSYDSKLIRDVRAVLRVLFLYIPLPIFWALFDQQGSRWTLQATRMDGDLFGVYRIKPDQIQVINPVLIIAMIPLFEYCLYPLLRKCNLLTRPLQKITVGGFLAAGSFVIAALVQIKIDSHEPVPVAPNHAHLLFVSGTSCNLNLSSSAEQFAGAKLEQFHVYEHDFDLSTQRNVTIDINAIQPCSYRMFDPAGQRYSPTLEPGVSRLVFITETSPINGKMSFTFREEFSKSTKPLSGGADIRIAYDLRTHPTAFFKNNSNLRFELRNSIRTYEMQLERPNNQTLGSHLTGISEKIEVDPTKGPIEVSFLNETLASLNFEQGGSYLLVVTVDNSKVLANLSTIVEPNDVSMMWQAIQYIVMTAGEIMFSITGLEFSYSQAPNSMKAVLQACWLMTVAFGNLIVVIIAKLHLFEKQTYEFIFFAGLMALDMIVFALMACCYVYADNSSEQQSTTNSPISPRTRSPDSGENAAEKIAMQSMSEKSPSDECRKC